MSYTLRVCSSPIFASNLVLPICYADWAPSRRLRLVHEGVVDRCMCELVSSTALKSSKPSFGEDGGRPSYLSSV
jgi:hypothetical protein